MLGTLVAVAPAAPALAASWTVVPSPNAAGSVSRFAAVDATGAADAWAVGWSQADWSAPTRPLAARWNGTAWSLVGTPTRERQRGAERGGRHSRHGRVGSRRRGHRGADRALERQLVERRGRPDSGRRDRHDAARGQGRSPANDAWAVGEYTHRDQPGQPYADRPLERHGLDAGAVAEPGLDGRTRWSPSTALAANDVWALGNMGHDGYGGDTVAGADAAVERIDVEPGGAAQRQRLADRASRPGSCTTSRWSSSNDVWAVGTAFSFATFTSVPYFVHWNGQTWQEGALPNPGPGALTTVAALSATKVYAFGDESRASR